MAPRATPAQIAMWARQRGLDPQAVLAVAATEGLSGGIGDSGHAFGPFQLNNLGGAYPAYAPQDPNAANEWAWSPQGINYALDRIAGVARGQTGPAAVNAIVRRFERPANPDAEVTRALANSGATPEPQPRSGHGGSPWNGVLGANWNVIGTPYHGTHTLGNWESDNAVDLSAKVGTPVYAVQGGTIGPQFGALGSSSPRMAGLRLHLDAPNDEFYYAHLSRFAPGIQPGSQVTRGQLLGYSGAANGVGHLHFSAEHGDPRQFIGAYAPTSAPAAPAALAGNAYSPMSPATSAAVTPRPRQLPAAVKQALQILRG